MTWNIYLIVIAVFGLIFFSVAIWALSWAIRKGQLRDFDKQSTVIFDDEEPEGMQMDRFPNQKAEEHDAPEQDKKS
ncbi:MAG: cbb3-type cytochrome oxidase assembly protein [Verrucomicrobiota bacterium]